MQAHRPHYFGAGTLCGLPEPPACGFGIPAGIFDPAWLALIEPMSPGAKQVTRPLAATRNSAGQAPLVRIGVVPVPCDCTVNSFPSLLPAIPTLIPGMSYET
jgi:hypothetical protein